MTFSNNPMLLAEKAQQMASRADKADGKVFQQVAMVSMIVMAAAGATQIMLQIMRELRKGEEKDHGRGGRER